MKFWELRSICRDKPKTLKKVFSQKKWRMYAEWNNDIAQLVQTQDREKLDAILPDELVEQVLNKHPGVLYLYGGHLRSYRFNRNEHKISYLKAFQKYGGTAVEDTLEKGSFKVADE